MNIDTNECRPWPADYIWKDERWINHRGEYFCGDGYHYQIRADERTGKPVLWVLGWCPRSETAGRIKSESSDALTFDNFDPKYQEKAYGAMRTWAEGFKPKKSRNVYIVGSFGTGKTHLATAASLAVRANGYHVVFVRAEELLDLFLAAMPTSNYPDEHNAAVRILRDMDTCDLLVIDDLGGQTTKQESDLFLQRLKALLDGLRGAWMITTNADGARMEARYGEPIMSRLRKDVMRVEMIGDDYRRKHGRKGVA